MSYLSIEARLKAKVQELIRKRRQKLAATYELTSGDCTRGAAADSLGAFLYSRKAKVRKGNVRGHVLVLIAQVVKCLPVSNVEADDFEFGPRRKRALRI